MCEKEGLAFGPHPTFPNPKSKQTQTTLGSGCPLGPIWLVWTLQCSGFPFLGLVSGGLELEACRDIMPEPLWGRTRGCWAVMPQCQAGHRAQWADAGAAVTSCPWEGASSHAVTHHRIQQGEGVGVWKRLPLSTDLSGTTLCQQAEKPQLPMTSSKAQVGVNYLLSLFCSSPGFCV